MGLSGCPYENRPPAYRILREMRAVARQQLGRRRLHEDTIRSPTAALTVTGRFPLALQQARLAATCRKPAVNRQLGNGHNGGRHKAMRPGRGLAEWHMLPSWMPPAHDARLPWLACWGLGLATRLAFRQPSHCHPLPVRFCPPPGYVLRTYRGVPQPRGAPHAA